MGDPAPTESDCPPDSERRLQRLLPQVYAELRALAAARMAGERRDHTLEPTALVHEAWLRLSGGKALDTLDPDERAQFFHAAAESMRRILVEHARSRQRLKRGGDRERLPGCLSPSVRRVSARPRTQCVGHADPDSARLRSRVGEGFAPSPVDRGRLAVARQYQHGIPRGAHGPGR